MRIQQLHVQRLGDKGPQLLMLHGWGRDMSALKPLAELLKCHYSIHLVDLPGFGKTPRPKEDWSAWDYAEFLQKYLKAQGLESSYIFGHSFGGKVATCMALRYPGFVERLTLTAPSAIRPAKSIKGLAKGYCLKLLRQLLSTCDRNLGTKYYQEKYIPNFASRDYLAAGEMRPILVKAVNTDLEPFLKQLTCPIQLLWGEKDMETPVEMAHRMRSRIPQLKLQILPQKGHEPFSGVGAHLVATLIEDFLPKEPLHVDG